MSIPNYKVAVQIEFKPRASLICFLKQGALLIRKVYAAFFPGSICGSSQESSHSNQTLETHRDSVLCIVPLAFTLSIAINLPEDRKQWMFSHQILHSQGNVSLLFKVHKIQYTWPYFPFLWAYSYMILGWLTWSLFTVLKGEKR